VFLQPERKNKHQQLYLTPSSFKLNSELHCTCTVSKMQIFHNESAILWEQDMTTTWVTTYPPEHAHKVYLITKMLMK